MKNTKKAVILKLLLVYLKTTLRKLHNTLLASYGLTHLFDLFWHSLNLHFVQRLYFIVYYLFWHSVIINSSTSYILLVFVFGEPKGFVPSWQDDSRALPEQSEAKA